MSISLILIGVISLVVVAGTVYLFINKSEELNESKKGAILVIVGIVIFVSLMVTTYKHRHIVFSSNDSNQNIDINQVYYHNSCSFEYQNKYQLGITIPEQNIKQLYGRNYLSYRDWEERLKTDTPDKHHERIVYLSKKDEGASYFLVQLAQQRCSQKKDPSIYLKLDKDLSSEEEFMRLVGVRTYDQLRQNLCYFSGVEIRRSDGGSQEYIPSQKHNNAFIIIDNFEYILNIYATKLIYEQPYEQQQNKQRRIKYVSKERLISKILQDLMINCQVDVILNTEKQSAIEDIYSIWQQSKQINPQLAQKDSLFPFQFHQWEGLKQYNLYKIITKTVPGSDVIASRILETNKKDEYNFQQFASIIEEVKYSIALHGNQIVKNRSGREDSSLKDLNMKLSVAKYYNLDKIYRQLKSSDNKRVSYLKGRISLEQLLKLQQIGLIQISLGNIVLK